MSSIASLYVLREPDVHAFAETGSAPAELELQDVFHWSGYFMMYLLLFLDEQDVPVGQSRFDDVLNGVEGLHYALTTEHQRYLPQLDPASFDQAAFDEFLDGMGWSDFEEAPIAVEETLTMLREQIAALHDDQVLLIEIC